MKYCGKCGKIYSNACKLERWSDECATLTCPDLRCNGGVYDIDENMIFIVDEAYKLRKFYFNEWDNRQVDMYPIFSCSSHMWDKSTPYISFYLMLGRGYQCPVQKTIRPFAETETGERMEDLEQMIYDNSELLSKLHESESFSIHCHSVQRLFESPNFTTYEGNTDSSLAMVSVSIYARCIDERKPTQLCIFDSVKTLFDATVEIYRTLYMITYDHKKSNEDLSFLAGALDDDNMYVDSEPCEDVRKVHPLKVVAEKRHHARKIY